MVDGPVAGTRPPGGGPVVHGDPAEGPGRGRVGAGPAVRRARGLSHRSAGGALAELLERLLRQLLGRVGVHRDARRPEAEAMSAEPMKDPSVPSAPVKRGTLTEETGNTGGGVPISEKPVRRVMEQGKLSP